MECAVFNTINIVCPPVASEMFYIALRDFKYLPLILDNSKNYSIENILI